ncbi:2'-5'-oligoadenylate synthase 1A-like [Amphiura filiformis]|uniref:2'-5'-oligoadenylate synthase 1A-like n=1 Tax=Amphiura filiformis TaxID=82378 RepID=UPI003B21E58A
MASNFSRQEPWNLSQENLQEWFQDNVEEGSRSFAVESNKSMDDLVRFLHNMPDMKTKGPKAKPVKVKEVRKGGSIEKGTFYKDGSDLDCVVVLNGIPKLKANTKTGKYRRGHLKPLVEKVVTALQQASFTARCEKVSNLQLKVYAKQETGGILEIDILFTGNNLDYNYIDDEVTMQRILSTPYNTMLNMPPKSQRFIYQPCLTPLQTEFVKSQPGNVKSLIRLVKYWKAEYLHQRQTEKLINSYTLELITIYVYEEEMGSPDRFDLGEGFKRVLSLLAYKLGGFQHYWDNFYSDETAQRGMKLKDMMKRPILLDPADPSDNVLQRWKKGLGTISEIARETLQTPLLRSIHVN